MRHIPILRRRSKAEKEKKEPREWVSWKLRKISLVSMFLITLGLAAGIITLLALSDIRHGFHSVTNRSSHFLVNWDIGLTWTTVPSFIFQLYGFGVGVVVTAFGFRQPFIELREGATAKKSIALDYQSYFPGQNAYRAAKNAHWHLAVPFVVSTLLTLAIGPLSSRMISEQSYSLSRTTTVFQDHKFFNQFTLDDPVVWDLAPVIGIASATTVYGGSPARWIDGKNVYLNFSSPMISGVNVSQPTLEANTSAFYSKLDCRVLNVDSDDTHWYILTDGGNSTAGRFYANATDRGCFWSMSFEIGESFSTYLQTSSNSSCGNYGASDQSGRLIVVAAQIENLQLSLLTMLSCVPVYWTSNGNITLNLDPGALHPIIDFGEDNATVTELRPMWWNLYEDQVHQIQFVDTTRNFDADSTTAIGSLILAFSRRNSSDPLSGDSLVVASQEIWQSMYATLVNNFMLRPAQRSNISAILTTTTNRLFVSRAIAGIILGFLFAVALLLIMIFVYTRQNASILFEEPIGVLGYAGLLFNSDLHPMVEHVRGAQDFRGETTKDIKHGIRAEKHTAVFRMDNFKNPRKAQIIKEGREANRTGSENQETTRLTGSTEETLASNGQASEVQDDETYSAELRPLERPVSTTRLANTQMTPGRSHEV